MLLTIIKANYQTDYQIELSFNNGETLTVDLKTVLASEKRKIFEPLKDIAYFKNFKLCYNTIVWDNEADFAPEFLYELALNQSERNLII